MLTGEGCLRKDVRERKACSLTRERSATVSLTHPLRHRVFLSISRCRCYLRDACSHTYVCTRTYMYICLLIGAGGRLCLFIYLPTMHCRLLLSCAAANPAMSPHTLANQIVPRHFANTNSRRQWLRYSRLRPARNEPTTQPKNCFWYFTHHALHVASSGAA